MHEDFCNQPNTNRSIWEIWGIDQRNDSCKTSELFKKKRRSISNNCKRLPVITQRDDICGNHTDNTTIVTFGVWIRWIVLENLQLSRSFGRNVYIQKHASAKMSYDYLYEYTNWLSWKWFIVVSWTSSDKYFMHIQNENKLIQTKTGRRVIQNEALVIWTTINQGMFEIGTNFLLKIKFEQYIFIEGLIMWLNIICIEIYKQYFYHSIVKLCENVLVYRHKVTGSMDR